jgi:hypothetical protein
MFCWKNLIGLKTWYCKYINLRGSNHGIFTRFATRPGRTGVHIQ